MGAEQGSRIIHVITMVTAIGILGNGLFGAGMRAVQDRETDVLRRYKVTPITPVPLLAASMVTGVILYLPGLILTLILANRLFGMVIPPNIGSFFLFAIIACVAFRSMGLIIASVVNSSQESLILIQPLYMAMLFLSGATFPLSFFPDWLQIVTQFIPATYLMIGIAGILQQGESVLQNWQAVVALVVTALVGSVHRHETFPLGKRREAAQYRQALGLGGAGAVPPPGRLPIVEPTGPRQSEDPRARHGARKNMADQECAHFCRRREGDRIGLDPDQGREDRRDLRRDGAGGEDIEGGVVRSRRQDGAAGFDRRPRSSRCERWFRRRLDEVRREEGDRARTAARIFSAA